MRARPINFRAVLERGAGRLGWTVARVPFAAREMWPEMIRMRVRGTVTGPGGAATFRTSLFAFAGNAGSFVPVTRAMRDGAGLTPEMEADFELEPDLEVRDAELAEELQALLDEVEGLRAWYDGLSGYMRREIGKWVGAASGEATRRRRAEQMAERLLSTMEAEVALPPLLAQAFQARAQARRGWRRMTAAQRRSELFAVFYYQGPEARQKRVAKLVEAAERRGTEEA